MTEIIKRYGWKRQLPDFRDFKVQPHRIKDLDSLPTVISLRAQMPPVYDQGDLGSCTGNAIAGALQHRMMVDKYKYLFTPSRLFIYYNERVIEGTVGSDAGADIRDGMKTINAQGVCPENQPRDTWNWPYDVSKFADKPSSDCYKDGVMHQALKYEAVGQTASETCSVIAEGYPVICGITCYESFESDETLKTGNVPMPELLEQVVGGHAILLDGYDQTKQTFNWRNSWGKSYGDEGYGTIPFKYILDSNLSSDFWIIQLVKE